MTYSKKDILTSISFMLFILSFAIVFVVFFKPLYYFDIHHLKLVENTHYTYQQIKENYQILIHYQSIFYQGKLVFKDFIMSKSGRIHFEEVKRIFEIIQIVCLLTFCTTSYLVYRQIKQKEYRFFKLTAILTIVIPLILGFFAFIDFDHLFVMFHQLAFSNDYWLFNPRLDPIINILPENFFMHCFMLIVFIVLFSAFICYKIYQHYQKTILAIDNHESYTL